MTPQIGRVDRRWLPPAKKDQEKQQRAAGVQMRTGIEGDASQRGRRAVAKLQSGPGMRRFMNRDRARRPGNDDDQKSEPRARIVLKKIEIT